MFSQPPFKIYRVRVQVLCLSAIFALLNTGCGLLKDRPEPVDEWLVKLGAASGLGKGYRVEREQHYPLATAAPLYLQGDDTAVVEDLSMALGAHFQDVSVLTPSVNAAAAGFLLEVDQDSQAKRLTIHIKDATTHKRFDRVQINFSESISKTANQSRTPAKRSLEAALNAAAASLAGSS